MTNVLKFNTTRPQTFRDMGGDHVMLYAGKCGLCKRRVYHEQDVKDGARIGTPYEADPRGVITPKHAAATLVAEEYGAQGKAPDALFCWDCLWEHGKMHYDACLAIAKRLWGAA